MEHTNNSQNVFSLQRTISRIFSKWYWILLSLILFGSIAYLINRFTSVDYEVTASLYIKSAKDKTNSIEQFLLSRGGEEEFNLSNEAFFLTSRSLVRSTLEELNFAVSYYEEIDMVRKELYKESPIEVVFDSTSQVPFNKEIRCLIKGRNFYSLATEDEEIAGMFKQSQYEFGKQYSENGFQFTVLLKKPSDQMDREIIFQLNTMEGLINEYTGKLVVDDLNEQSSILILKTTGKNVQKEKDFLNTHLNKFVEQDLKEKNLATARTSDFIDQILAKNTGSLDSISRGLQEKQEDYATLAPEITSNRVQDELQQLERKKAEINLSYQILTALREQLQRNAEISQLAIPTNVGIDNPVLTSNLQELTKLQQQLIAMGADPNSQNPLIRSRFDQVTQLKKNILENISGLITGLNIQIRNLDSQIANYQTINSRVIPKASKEYEDIRRNFTATNEMVNFLMEKKAEAGIARASTASNYKPIDYAMVTGMVQNPIKNYVTALIIGLLLPIALIILKDTFNNKVVTKNDLAGNTTLPLLGIIGYDGQSKKSAITYNYKASLTAESFRSVRTNLSYFIDSEEGGKVLMFISSIPREGKTFCSKYMAFILSISGKKTLLINADMRKPDGNSDLEVEGFTGLSHYLSGKATINEVVMRTKVDNLFYVRSGEVPPNPAELLLNARMKQMVDVVRESFDYIIIDTPPISAFSDSTVLIKYTDLAICVVRQNYTTKTLLQNFNDLYANNPNIKMSVLFNHVDMEKLDSGYKASYYNSYYPQQGKSSWWKQLLPG